MDGSMSEALALEGKTIVLGVSGSIAAFKAVEVLRRLTKSGANVVTIRWPPDVPDLFPPPRHA